MAWSANREDRAPLVLVLGMHRSGTSGITSILLGNGGWSGDDGELVPASINNQAGFFERRDLIDLQESWLSRLGATWDCPPSHQVLSEFRLEAVGEARAYLLGLRARQPQASSLVLKDPRMCLFAPLWLDAEPNAMVVIPFRHPAEVAESLWKRDRIPFAHAVLLWQKYLMETLDATRGRKVVMVNFTSLMRAVQDDEVHQGLAIRDLIQTVWGPVDPEHMLAVDQLCADLASNCLADSVLHRLEESVLPFGARMLWQHLEKLDVVSRIGPEDLMPGADAAEPWWPIDRVMHQWSPDTSETDVEQPGSQPPTIEQSPSHVLSDTLRFLSVSVQAELQRVEDRAFGFLREAEAAHRTAVEANQRSAVAQSQLDEAVAELAVVREQLSDAVAGQGEERAKVQALVESLGGLEHELSMARGDVAAARAYLVMAQGDASLVQSQLDEAVAELAVVREKLSDAVAGQGEERAKVQALVESLGGLEHELSMVRGDLATAQHGMAQAHKQAQAHVMAIAELSIEIATERTAKRQIQSQAVMASGEYVREIEAAAVRIRSLDQALSELRGMLDGIAGNYLDTQATLEAVVTSRSWRFTRMLRRDRTRGHLT